MNRCKLIYRLLFRTALRPAMTVTSKASFLIATCVLGIAASGLFLTPLQAQQAPDAAPSFERAFPPNALRGTLHVTAPPQVLLDGKADHLAPAARILNPQNMMVMSGALVGQDYLVNYTRGAGGQIQQVWLLTPKEAAVRRPTAGGDEPGVGTFLLKLIGLDFTPTAPPRDDGKTPFNQLPVYPNR